MFVSEADHEGEGFDVAERDAAGVGPQDAAGERGVLVVLGQPPRAVWCQGPVDGVLARPEWPAGGGVMAPFHGVQGGSCGVLAAQPGRVGGQVFDVVVGEVGGLDPARDAGLGQQPADPSGQRVDVGGGVSLGGPALAEHGV